MDLADERRTQPERSSGDRMSDPGDRFDEQEMARIDEAFENLVAREAAGLKRGFVSRAMRHLATREANSLGT